MMFFWCTFQVRASSSCNCSRRAAKAAAKAFEGAWNHGMEWKLGRLAYSMGMSIGTIWHSLLIDFSIFFPVSSLAFFRRWPKTIRCRFWTSSWNLRADDFRIDLGSIPWDPKGVNTKGAISHWQWDQLFPCRTSERINFLRPLFFTLKAPCVDSYVPQCGGCVHSWKLRQILSQSSNARGEHHSWSMKVKLKIGRWASSEHAMICLAAKEDELCANDSLIFG